MHMRGTQKSATFAIIVEQKRQKLANKVADILEVMELEKLKELEE